MHIPLQFAGLIAKSNWGLFSRYQHILQLVAIAHWCYILVKSANMAGTVSLLMTSGASLMKIAYILDRGYYLAALRMLLVSIAMHHRLLRLSDDDWWDNQRTSLIVFPSHHNFIKESGMIYWIESFPKVEVNYVSLFVFIKFLTYRIKHVEQPV